MDDEYGGLSGPSYLVLYSIEKGNVMFGYWKEQFARQVDINKELCAKRTELAECEIKLENKMVECDKLAAQTRSFIKANNELEKDIKAAEGTITTQQNQINSLGRTIKDQKTHLNNIKAAANIMLDAIDDHRVLNTRVTINKVGQCEWEHLDDDFPVSDRSPEKFG